MYGFEPVKMLHACLTCIITLNLFFLDEDYAKTITLISFALFFLYAHFLKDEAPKNSYIYIKK